MKAHKKNVLPSIAKGFVCEIIIKFNWSL